MYALYLRSGPEHCSDSNAYGYYAGNCYQYQYGYYPIYDKKIVMRTKGYTTKARAEKALESLIVKCEYVHPSSYLVEIPDKKKRVWAVYRTEDRRRLYAMEYINSIEKCKDIPGGHLLKDTDEPIVVNGMGGRTSFETENFVEFRTGETYPVSREEEFPKNLPVNEFRYGWIDPEGNTYACGFEGHYDCAAAILEEQNQPTSFAQRKLEDLGWATISRPAPYTWENYGKRTCYKKDAILTDAQIRVVTEMGLTKTDRDTKDMVLYTMTVQREEKLHGK